MILEGEKIKTKGYVSDIITEDAMNLIDRWNPSKSFMLMLHHKAPHRPWDPIERYKDLYEDLELTEPGSTFRDQY